VQDEATPAHKNGPNPAYAVLDGVMALLARPEAAGLTPLTVRGAGGRALLVFDSASLAKRHLAALPAAAQDAYTAVCVAAWDDRAKTEWLEAAARVGCVRLDVNPNAALEPAASLPLAKALAYMASKKTGTACL
jgi:hypothetical protein